MMLVQAGKEYKEGEAVVKRTASLINFMWTDLLRDRDTIGLPLHQEKIGLTEVYTKALQELMDDKELLELKKQGIP